MSDHDPQAPVALLIPVYNRQELLNRSCASLLSDVRYDVVIVDDGSDSVISAPYGLDPARVTLLRLEQNQGITRALNHGLRWVLQKNYKYVARLDAGDLMLPKRIDRQFEFLESHPGHAIVGGQVRFVDMQGDEAFHDNYPTSDAAIRRAMHGRSCFVHVSVMLRAAAVRAAGPYDERYPNAEDFELFWRLLRHWKGANLEETVVESDVNPHGLSVAKRSQQVRSRIRILLKYFDPRVPESYVGVLKNVILLVIPYRWVRWLKRRYVRPNRGWL